MEATLMLSSTRGRYALCVGEEGKEGSDITSGQFIQIKLGGYWLSATIEYNAVYAAPGPQTLGDAAQMASRPKAISGYYALVDGGGIIGLCVGMKVRI